MRRFKLFKKKTAGQILELLEAIALYKIIANRGQWSQIRREIDTNHAKGVSLSPASPLRKWVEEQGAVGLHEQF